MSKRSYLYEKISKKIGYEPSYLTIDGISNKWLEMVCKSLGIDNYKMPICPYCKSKNTMLTGVGGFMEADASRNIPETEATEIGCCDCGRTWWD